MQIDASSIGGALGNIKDKASGAVKKGEDWFKEEAANLENLVSQGSSDAKNKLMQLAQKYNVPVNDKMDMNEIKNKIKAKLRGMK